MLKRWRFSWAWTVGVVLACGLSAGTLGACNGLPPIPNPFPTPTPEPTPPPVDCKPLEAKVEVACAAGEPFTDECKAAQSEWLFSPCAFDPPPDPVCDPNVGLVTECWHMPPGKHWQWIPKPVVPTPVPTPTPDPGTDPPAVPLIADEDLVADETDTRKETFSLTNAAMGRWRVKHPEKWNGAGTCLVDRGAGIDAAFAAVAAELGAVGVVAGQSIKVSGQRSDAIFVNRRGTNRYEETHLFHSGTGCAGTSSNVIKFTYVRSGGVQPAPPSDCTDPQPPPLQFIKMKCDRGGKWPCDATPQVFGFEYKGPGTNYCAEIGLGEMPGQPGVERRTCPAGNDDNGPRRRACERVVLGSPGPPAPALWRSFSGHVEVNPENHLQARCAAGIDCSWIEVCHSGGLQCTRVPAP
jgi:hypothetical protein